MAESTVVRTKRDGVIAITDGATTYTVDYEPGDFTFDVPLYGVDLFLNRGAIDSTPSIRKADDAPVTGGFSAYMRDIASNTDDTLLDIAVRFAAGTITGGWTSTIGSNSDVTTWTVTLTIEGSDFGGSDRTLTFSYCVVRGGGTEGQPNSIPITFTSYALRPVLS